MCTHLSAIGKFEEVPEFFPLPKDAAGLVTGFTYDAAGRKLSEQRGVGTAVQQAYARYGYTANGLVAYEADALWSGLANDNAHRIRYGYDGFDRQGTTSYADDTSERNDYDPNGNVLVLTTRQGLQIKNRYDALNRKFEEKGWNLATGHEYFNDWWTGIKTSTFGYDLAGRMTSVANDIWPLGWSYDAAGRPRTHTQGWIGSFTTSYDGSGNPVEVDHPSGVVESFVYDGLNRMASASITGGATTTIAYDALSRRTGITFGDGSTTGYVYDDADRLVTQSHVFPSQGCPTPQTWPGGPHACADVVFAFGYDNAGRLTSKTSSNSAYLDAPAAASTGYGPVNGLNEYASVGGATASYALDGSLQAAGPRRLRYDEKRQLGEIDDTASGAFRVDLHDALGRRWVDEHSLAFASGAVSQYDETGFGYDGIRPDVRTDLGFVLTVKSSNPGVGCTISGGWETCVAGWRDYLLGPNPDERLAYRDTNGQVYYPHADRQGTTIALSTAGGQNVLTRTYGPYGEPRQGVNPLGPGASSYAYLYTGQHYDPSFGGFIASVGAVPCGLFDYKARLYDACTGRFLQPDPIGPKDDENLYSAFHYSPYQFSDPEGMEAAKRREPGEARYRRNSQPLVAAARAPTVNDVANAVDAVTVVAVVVETVATGGASAAGPDEAEIAAERAVTSAIRNAARPGRLGGAAHRATVENVAGQVEQRGLLVERELHVRTPGGEKSSRFVDVAGRNPRTGRIEEMHQVGRATKSGQPVARESRALEDIEGATGERPSFHPYDP